MSDNKQEYCWSHDEEIFHGRCLSIDEAVADAISDYMREHGLHPPEIYVAEITQHKTIDNINGLHTLESIEDNAGDDVGEWVIGWLDPITKNKDKLDEFEELIAKFIDDNCEKKFYIVGKTVYTIKKDFEEPQ